MILFLTCFYLTNLLIIDFLASGTNKINQKRVINIAGTNKGKPSINDLIIDTIEVNGNKYAKYCKYLGKVSNGKNTPQNKNIGNISKYCGYDISSIVLDFDETNKPKEANIIEKIKQNGKIINALTGSKSPVIEPISKTTKTENEDLEASHIISPHKISDKVTGVTATA